MHAPYHDYVNDMLRQYFAPACKPIPPGSVAELNRAVTASVVSGFSRRQRAILRDIFSEPEQPLGPLIKKCAESHNMPEMNIWHTIRAASRKIARERGLIDQDGRE